ncbi:MAG: hypothetical protein ACLSVG_00965 [Clostridia bacterium]
MVDPTALNEQKLQKQQKGETKNLRAFLFSLLGAVTGAAVCMIVDYFMGNITGLVYLFVGMSAYAFYQYFVERKDQRNFHMLLLVLACILATMLAVFADCAILYAQQVREPDMNFIEKTFELYRINIAGNGLSSYKHSYADGASAVFFDLSILSFHIVCAVMALIGLFLSWTFVRFATKSWEKKHHGQNADYSYASRKKNAKRKQRH